jgi:hypothetical protein
MRLSGAVVVTLADYLSVRDHNGAHHRVWRGPALGAGGEAKGAAHETLV